MPEMFPSALREVWQTTGFKQWCALTIAERLDARREAMERRNMFFDRAMSFFLCGITMVVIAGVVLHAHIGMRNYRADICDGTGATLVIRPCGIFGGRECGFTNVTVHRTGATAELRFPIHSPALLPAGGITRWFALVKGGIK